MGKIVLRSKKKAFMEVLDTFERMKGFTALATSKNPIEYSRQYVDDDFETTDIIGMSTSLDFTFDLMQDNAVHGKLTDIIDEEKLGDDAKVTILQVDFTKDDGVDEYKAVKRDFTVVPESEGDGTEAYQYSGAFRVKGNKINGTATSTDNWETCTFVEEGAGI